MLPSNMLLLNLVLPIDVTFSTPTPVYNICMKVHTAADEQREFVDRSEGIRRLTFALLPALICIGTATRNMAQTEQEGAYRFPGLVGRGGLFHRYRIGLGCFQMSEIAFHEKAGRSQVDSCPF